MATESQIDTQFLRSHTTFHDKFVDKARTGHWNTWKHDDIMKGKKFNYHSCFCFLCSLLLSTSSFNLFSSKTCACWEYWGAMNRQWINKGPVKLMQRMKIAHSFLQSESNLFHFIILTLPMWFYIWLSKNFSKTSKNGEIGCFNWSLLIESF